MIIIISYRVFFCKSFVLYLLTPPLPTNSQQPLIFFFLLFPQYCLFQNVIQLESHSVCPFKIGLFPLVIWIYVFSMSFHGLMSHFFLVLNNISSSGHTTVIDPFNYQRSSWLLPSFGNYETSCYKYCMPVFVWTCFQPLWVNTRVVAESYGKNIFSFVTITNCLPR